jgi:ABC-type branched-subunit amino acid transport system permease subunit
MFELLGVPPQALFGQVLLGLINGSFYAILSLGLAVIFGLLNIINFAHGAQYMMGAFVAWMCLNYLGINYWAALLLAPIARRRFTGVVIERFLLEAHRKIRPPLRPAADLRPGADHPGPVPQLVTVRLACPISIPAAAAPAAITSASCSCRPIAAGSSSPRSSSAWPPGS